MTRNRDAWMERIRAIEREALAMELAAVRLGEQVRADSTILDDRGFGPRDLKIATENIDGTYLIRVFAEFEAALRSYRATIKPTHPRVRDLLDGLASHMDIQHRILAAAHLVREYRNGLVHERTGGLASVPLADARQACCRFLARLPAGWE